MTNRIALAVAIVWVAAMWAPSTSVAGTTGTYASSPATITGTDASEGVFGTPDDDVIDALDGSDDIYPQTGSDATCGGPGPDLIQESTDKTICDGDGCVPAENSDRLNGGPGDDILFGGARKDLMKGGSGNDMLGVSPFGGRETGVDSFSGGGGDDTIDANDRAREHVAGGGGMDTIHADDGRGGDVIDAGPGTDVCFVDAGDDVQSCEDVSIVSSS